VVGVVPVVAVLDDPDEAAVAIAAPPPATAAITASTVSRGLARPMVFTSFGVGLKPTIAGGCKTDVVGA
jgi:hypothetical protein